MNLTSANVRLAVLASVAALALALPGLPAEQPKEDAKRTPPEKGQPVTVAELNQTLKAGLFKLTEADVVNLLGRPSGVRRPGDAGSDLQLHWEYASYIFATFKDGKLSDLTGSFSEQLPVEQVTLANFKRLRVGMSEAQVVEVLGKGNGTAKVGATVTRSWGRTARLWASFNVKGLACGRGLQESSAVSLPPEVRDLVPGPAK